MNIKGITPDNFLIGLFIAFYLCAALFFVSIFLSGCEKAPLQKLGLNGCIEYKILNDQGEKLHANDPFILVYSDSGIANGSDSTTLVNSLYRSNLLDNYGATYDSLGEDRYIQLYFHEDKKRKRSTIYASKRNLTDTTGIAAKTIRWGINGFNTLYLNSRTPHLIEVGTKVQYNNKVL